MFGRESRKTIFCRKFQKRRNISQKDVGEDNMVIEDHNEDDVVPLLTTISEESTQSNENLIEQPRNEGAKKND